MTKEIFYNKDLVTCFHKITSDNKSYAALRKARSKAFISKYMADPGWTWKIKEKDMKSAAGLSFSDWLKTVDVRDYFVDSKLLNDLLEEMSASEIKLVLADEMKIYYDAFRENVTCSVFEEEEKGDYDGDHHEKLKSDKIKEPGKNSIDHINETAHDHHKEECKNHKDDDDLDEDITDKDLEELIKYLHLDTSVEKLRKIFGLK